MKPSQRPLSFDRRRRPSGRSVNIKMQPRFEVAVLEMMEIRKFNTISKTIRYMISVSKALLQCEKEGLTEIHVRNPVTGEQRQLKMLELA